MQRRTVFSALVAIFVFAAIVRADLTIIDSTGAPVAPENYVIAWDETEQAYDIVLLGLFNPWGDTTYEIHGNGGESIDRLEIAVNGPTAGSPLIVRVISDGLPGLNSVNEIVQTGTAETLLNRVEVNVDVGRIEVLAVGNIIAGRNIVGPITATTPSNAARGITLVQAGHDVLGDLYALNGRIKEVIAGREIGTDDQPIEIRAGQYIGRIQANGNCYAQIDSTFGSGGGHIASFDVASFFGSMLIKKLKYVSGYTNPGQIRFRDCLEGSIIIEGGFRAEELTTFVTGVGGIAGQIILNASADPSCVWTGPIQIGEDGIDVLTLETPDYAESCEQLGGGSVGLVPFLIHNESCQPINGGEVEQVGSAGVVVNIRFYGPLVATESMPVDIARRSAGSQTTFEAVPGSQFVAEILPGSPQVLRLTRAWMQSGFESGYEYRITPRPSLQCLLPDPVPVADGQVYLVTVRGAGPQCLGDSNGDGQVGAEDFTQLLVEFGQTGDGLAADFDGNGSVDLLDFTIILVHWGPCETRSVGSPAGGARKTPNRVNARQRARGNKGKSKRARQGIRGHSNSRR